MAIGFLFFMWILATTHAQEEDDVNGGLIAGVVIVFLIVIIALLASVYAALRVRRSKIQKLNVTDTHPYKSPRIDLPSTPISVGQGTLKPATIIRPDADTLTRHQKPKKPRKSSVRQVTGRPIKLDEINNVISNIDNAEFEREYNEIPKGQQKSWNEAEHTSLIAKNKYKNILPYDENRVRLDPDPEDDLSEYINASFISSYDLKKETMFIAAQGPKESSLEDFWRMIWQYDVYFVIMLTKTIEGMKKKCEKYWPDEGDLYVGDFMVTHREETRHDDIIVRNLQVTKGSESREIKHLHYVNWLDFGVVDCTSGIFKLRQLLRDEYPLHSDSPVIVHCSAGVGRSGTFIAIDQLLEQAERERYVDVLGMVSMLRQQRVNMVQTLGQYKLIYHAINERLSIGETTIEFSAAEATLENLINTTSGKEKLAAQYKFLEENKPTFDEADFVTALAMHNSGKNQSTIIIPAEHHRLQLDSRQHGENYINAIQVDGIEWADRYIVTHEPMDNTMEDFWTMVLDYDLRTVLFLADDLEKPKWLPNQENILELGPIVVKFKQEENEYKQRVLHVQAMKRSVIEGAEENPYTNVSQADETVYQNTAIGQSLDVTIVQRLVGDTDAEKSSAMRHLRSWIAQHTKTRDSIVVMCFNGATDTGLMIAADMLLSNLHKQKSVNVFNTVQKIRPKRPQFIGDIEQFTLLHKIVLDAIKEEHESHKT